MDAVDAVEIVGASAAVLSFGKVASLVVLSALALGLLALLATCLFVVPNGAVAVVERLGRISGVKRAGLHLKAPWPLARVLGEVPTGVLQGGGDLALRTRDGAPLRISVEARLTIPAREAVRALGALDNPREEVDALVCDHLGRRLSEFTLGELTQSRGRLALELLIDLGDELKGYGLRVINVVVGEPRTTVDVWRLRELSLPVLPAPSPPPVPVPASAPVPDAGPVCGSDEALACGAMEENAWLHMIVAVRAANPGLSEESILGIVYKRMNEDLMLRAMNSDERAEYNGNLLIIR